MQVYIPVVNQTPFYIDSRSTICLHDKNAQVYQIQKTGDVVVSHRHATIANALIKT